MFFTVQKYPFREEGESSSISEENTDDIQMESESEDDGEEAEVQDDESDDVEYDEDSDDESNEDISSVTKGEIKTSEEGDFDLIDHILSKRNDVKEPPKIISIKNYIEDLKFYESQLLAVATVKGDVLLIKYGGESPKKLKLLENHVNVCRSIDFSSDGKVIISVSTDKSIVVSDMETFNLVWFAEGAHDHPLTVVCSTGENTFVTGDTDGCIKFWDLRTRKQAFSVSPTDEYISSIVSSEEYTAVLGSDGTVVGFDARRLKKLDQSFLNCGCLSSGALFRDESRLIIGGSDGDLVFYKWGEFDYPLEQYSPRKGTGINQIVAARNLVGAVGFEDGLIRAVNFYPNQSLGIIGFLSDGIESLAVSSDGSHLASACFDNTIKIWDISYLDSVVQYKNMKLPSNSEYHLPSSQGVNSKDFFSDL